MTETSPQAITRVLCATDGSEAACRAAEAAGCIARDLQADLMFVSVAKAAKMTPELQEYLKAEGLEGERLPLLSSDAEACLERAAEIAKGCSVPNAKQAVRVGEAFDEVAATIRNERIDLVILGHHTRSTARRLARKPLSQRIADEVPVKVLLVP